MGSCFQDSVLGERCHKLTPNLHKGDARKIFNRECHKYCHQSRLGADLLETNSAGKDLGDDGGQQAVHDQQCAPVDKKAKGIMGHLGNSIASRLREMILPLYSVIRVPSTLMRGI